MGAETLKPMDIELFSVVLPVSGTATGPVRTRLVGGREVISNMSIGVATAAGVGAAGKTAGSSVWSVAVGATATLAACGLVWRAGGAKSKLASNRPLSAAADVSFFGTVDLVWRTGGAKSKLLPNTSTSLAGGAALVATEAVRAACWGLAPLKLKPPTFGGTAAGGASSAIDGDVATGSVVGSVTLAAGGGSSDLSTAVLIRVRRTGAAKSKSSFT
jgi:hypothetical protein